jgi:hypothetical protein
LLRGEAINPEATLPKRVRMVHVAPLERPMACAVCSMLSPNSRGSSTDCAKRNSSAVRAVFNSLRAASMCSDPLTGLAMIAP